MYNINLYLRELAYSFSPMRRATLMLTSLMQLDIHNTNAVISYYPQFQDYIRKCGLVAGTRTSVHRKDKEQVVPRGKADLSPRGRDRVCNECTTLFEVYVICRKCSFRPMVKCGTSVPNHELHFMFHKQRSIVRTFVDRRTLNAYNHLSIILTQRICNKENNLFVRQMYLQIFVTNLLMIHSQNKSILISLTSTQLCVVNL